MWGYAVYACACGNPDVVVVVGVYGVDVVEGGLSQAVGVLLGVEAEDEEFVVLCGGEEGGAVVLVGDGHVVGRVAGESCLLLCCLVEEGEVPVVGQSPEVVVRVGGYLRYSFSG